MKKDLNRKIEFKKIPLENGIYMMESIDLLKEVLFIFRAMTLKMSRERTLPVSTENLVDFLNFYFDFVNIIQKIEKEMKRKEVNEESIDMLRDIYASLNLSCLKVSSELNLIPKEEKISKESKVILSGFTS